MAKYRKKPVVIEAVKFLGFNKDNGHVELSERPDWLITKFGNKVLFFAKPNTLTIQTLEGNMEANIGDYIIQGVNGELYPCKPDIFEKTYEKIGEDNFPCINCKHEWKVPEKDLDCADFCPVLRQARKEHFANKKQ